MRTRPDVRRAHLEADVAEREERSQQRRDAAKVELRSTLVAAAIVTLRVAALLENPRLEGGVCMSPLLLGAGHTAQG